MTRAGVRLVPIVKVGRASPGRYDDVDREDDGRLELEPGRREGDTKLCKERTE